MQKLPADLAIIREQADGDSTLMAGQTVGIRLDGEEGLSGSASVYFGLSQFNGVGYDRPVAARRKDYPKNAVPFS